MGFIDENCVVFDSEEENKFEYSIVHQKFQELVDSLLTNHLGNLNVTPEAFAEACERARYASRHNKVVFEQLMAMEDFLTFKKLMVKRNMELELEAVQMMQQESVPIVKLPLVAAAADAEAKAKAEKEASEAQAALKKAAAEAAAAEEARIAKKKQAEEIAKQQAKAEEEAAASSLALEQIKIEDKSGEDAYDPHTRPRQATVDIVVSGPASNLDAEAMATVSENSNQRDDKNANPADSTTSKSKQSPSLTEKLIMKSSSAKPEVVHEVPDDIIVLKERAGYEPTVEEIDNYAEWLGLEDDEDHLMWIPRKAMSSPLPKPWKPCKARDTGEVFYFNPLTNESLWHHPQDDHWANLFAQCKVSEKVTEL